MSILEQIEKWAEAQLHRDDIDHSHIRKLVTVARAVRGWREAVCDTSAGTIDRDDDKCVGDNHAIGCPVMTALLDIGTVDDAMEIP